jgi:hypothetical protein
MRASEPSSVALPLVSLGQPVRFWVLTVLVPLASPESPPPASSDHRRSSPVLLSLTGGPALSVTARAREPKPAARVWAAPTDWAGPVTGFSFSFWFWFFFIYFTVLNAVCDFHI